MNKNVIAVLAITLLMMFAAVAPVFAGSQKWVPVTVTRAGSSSTFPTETWLTEGNTLHARNGTSGFATFVIEGAGVDLHGHSHSKFNFDINLNNGRGIWKWDITLYFSGGTFEGRVQVDGTYKIVNNMPFSTDAVQSGTFHGTGNYQGWTFKIEVAPGNVVTASMLIP